jgi:hypothetical protein
LAWRDNREVERGGFTCKSFNLSDKVQTSLCTVYACLRNPYARYTEKIYREDASLYTEYACFERKQGGGSVEVMSFSEYLWNI